MLKMDRTAFRRQKAEEADLQLDYWLEKSLQSRLQAARLLNAAAWGYKPDQPPSLKKEIFKARKRMKTETFYQDFLEFFQALNTEKVDYILVGGYAVILHGYPRTTGDLDIWVRPDKENYKKLQRAFQRFRMPVFDMTLDNFLDTDEFDVFTFGVPPVSIDIMTRVKGLTFEKAFTKAEMIVIDDQLSIRLIYFDDFLAAKRASGRNKEFNDISHLGGSV